MYRVFNMGIGLALIVSPFYAESIRRMLEKLGYPNFLIGTVSAGAGSTIVGNKQ
jgi:phosphoribosylformylglycinamidine cyclo-ligase